MKKLIKAAIAMMLILAMTVSVSAVYNGSVYQGEIPDFGGASMVVDGKTETVYSWELVILPTSIANVSDAAFKTAYTEVKNSKDLTTLVPGLKDALPAGVGAEDLVVRDVFDVKYLGNKKWTSMDVTLKPAGVTGNDTVIVLHKSSINGWEVVPSTVAWDGSVTATFTDLSPVAIVTLKTTAVNGNGPTSPATGDVNVACGLIAAALLLA